jgi:hypothetical protein
MNKKERKAIRNMTRDEQLALIDAKIDEAAQLWKDYARQSDFGFSDLLSRAHDRGAIISPRQR